MKQQFIPMKPIKRGYKIWAMAYSVTGYLVAFEIDTTKNPSEDIKHGLGEQVFFENY